eukprot:7848619-Pyramimonas_sp.AAC.1
MTRIRKGRTLLGPSRCPPPACPSPQRSKARPARARIGDQSDEGRGYIPPGRTNQMRGEGHLFAYNPPRKSYVCVKPASRVIYSRTTCLVTCLVSHIHVYGADRFEVRGAEWPKPRTNLGVSSAPLPSVLAQEDVQ